MSMLTPLRVTALALLVGLASCAPTHSARPQLAGHPSSLVARVAPERGEGASYQPTEAVNLQLTTRKDGYLTLISLRPDKTAALLAQNLPLKAGQNTVSVDLGGIEGLHTVRAIVTLKRPTTDLVLRGTYDGNTWNAATNEWLTPYALDERDVQETYLYVKAAK